MSLKYLFLIYNFNIVDSNKYKVIRCNILVPALFVIYGSKIPYKLFHSCFSANKRSILDGVFDLKSPTNVKDFLFSSSNCYKTFCFFFI